MDMPKVTFLFAGFLIVLGVGGYVATGAQSATALIPAFFGIVFAIIGFVAQRHLQHGMHAAALLAVLALLGTARSLTKLPALFSGDVERPSAVIAQAIMAIACIAFIALCVKSFVDARRAREGAQG